MRVGVTISAVLHAAALAWGLISFSAKPFEAASMDYIPVDLVTASELSQLTAGAKSGTKADTPKPLVEKVADPKPVKEPTPKIVEKPEIVSTAEPPPPAPEPEKKVETKPETAKPEPRVDPIAEALKKDEAQKPPKAQAKTIPTPPKKPAPQAPKFDADRITALLDKRNPQRVATAGEVINPTPALGSTTGSAPTLSASETDLFKRRLRDCWDVPVALRDIDQVTVPIIIRFKIDGTLASPPEPENKSRDPKIQALTESAVRAVIRCQPYTMFSRSKYEAWKEIAVNFNPKDLFGGE
jgi:outer membrane biosynthesis protein TonB